VRNRKHLIHDITIPFQLEGCPVRGRIVRLSTIATTLKQQHNYPPLVQESLLQLVTLALILSSGFKYEGIFTLQVVGNGPLRLMVVDITHDYHIRACARFDAALIEQLAAKPLIHPALSDLCGEGHLIFTVDQPTTTERYQGIVALSGKTLAESLHHYFEQSEQLRASLVLFTRQNLNPRQQTQKNFYELGALFIQQMPLAQTQESWDSQQWEDLTTFISTVSVEELLNHDLTPETLLHRLFWQEGVRLHPEKIAIMKCRCSQEKIANLLKTFPVEDRQAMIVEGKIFVTCEFCNQIYDFDPF
jgi:molecular chaperone Hsp33